MPDHLPVPDRPTPMLVRVAVPAIGSMTRMSVALYGAQYSLPSGPAAMPDHLSVPDRFAPMFVRWAIAITHHPRPPDGTPTSWSPHQKTPPAAVVEAGEAVRRSSMRTRRY